MTGFAGDSNHASQPRFRPYPEYRDSDVEWLSMVPTHWPTDRLKWTIITCRNGIWGDEPDGVNDIACVRVADFDRTRFLVHLEEPTIRAVAPSQRTGRLLSNGDLLLEKSGGGELQPVGAVMLFDHNKEAVCSNFVARMPVATGFDGRFLAYFHAHLYSGRVNTRSIKQTTGIQNLDSDSYLNELVPFVPIVEQRAIVTFLDRETARIDELIAKKRRLIELLAEKRSALISHAVTKGLNPDAPMKNSGVEWLGTVPASWAVLPAKRVSSVFVPERNKPELNDAGDGFPWITPEDIGGKDVPTPSTNRWVSRAAATINHSRPLAQGSVLASCVGSFGVASVNTEACIINQQIQGYVPRRVDSYFLRYVVSVSGTYFETVATATTLKYINQESFGELPIALPSSTEQRDIVHYLDAATEAIECLSVRITEAVAMLREYRSALVSAAVTGKIDVRNEESP